MLYNDSLSPLHSLVAILVSTSVTKRPTSLAKTSATSHLHRRLHSLGGGGLHLPRFHHLQQPLPRHWTEQRNCKAEQHWNISERRSWTTPCWPSAPRWTCTAAWVLSTLLHGSETGTLHSRQERRLNTLHLRCLRRILGITWQDRIQSEDVLAQAGVPSMFALLIQRRLRWLGHVSRMDGAFHWN